MELRIGIKSDPILYRYTYTWLFKLMQELDIKYLQLGSFFELYSLEDAYFKELKAEAEKYNIRIKSCFTSHRELGGFFAGNSYMRKVAFDSYKRFIEVAALLGSDYVGSNPGTIYRDEIGTKNTGIGYYLNSMKELMIYGKEKGLKGLTIEPMSSLAEPPSTPKEITFFLDELNRYYGKNIKEAIPVFLCGDISHGVADAQKKIVHNNIELFEFEIPYMAEFHFKNTDNIFNRTFGFSKQEQKEGIVDLYKLKELIVNNDDLWPVKEVVGYLEINGPKLGRDYTDRYLEGMIRESVNALKDVFNDENSEL